MKVEINKIFTAEKGKKKARWKVIEHPNFPGQLALGQDYAGMMSYSPKRRCQSYEWLCNYRRCLFCSICINVIS